MRTARDVFLGMGMALLLSGCAASVAPEPHSLIAKRVFVQDQNDMIVNLGALRTDLHAYVDALPESTGLYFEYLPSGASIGVHSDERFVAASLLKLPIAIEAYKLRAEGLVDFGSRVRMEPGDIDKRYGTLWQRGAGTEFTLGEVVRLTLVESDDTARAMLMRVLATAKPDFVDDAFDDLDIPKELSGNNPVVSAKNYSSILRSLYLATSLSVDDAQDILTQLSQSAFRDQMPAGVPPGMQVAHKIGVYDVDGETTYSDCGIVYAPKRPFMLCVMTKASHDRATQIIRDLSRMAYEFIAAAPVSDR